MAQLKNLIVNGSARILGTTYLNSITTNTLNVTNGATISGGGSVAPLILKNGNNSYRQGLRIMMNTSDNWSTILLGGSDTTEASGTSSNSWGLLNNNGNFYITRNGLSTGTSLLKCESNVWSVSSNFLPITNNSQTLGTSSLKWSNVYSTIFTGKLATYKNGSTTETCGSNYLLYPQWISSTLLKLKIYDSGSSTDWNIITHRAYGDENGLNIATNYMLSQEITGGDIDALQVSLSGKSGRTGSINLSKKSSGIGSEMPSGWYNFIFSPHRFGSTNDNMNYGTTLMFPMTSSGTSYIVRRSASATTATEVRAILDSVNYSNYIPKIGYGTSVPGTSGYKTGDIYIVYGNSNGPSARIDNILAGKTAVLVKV